VAVEGTARLRCSRCLEDFETGIRTGFTVEFRERVEGPEDEDVQLYSGDYVDLGEQVRQNLILSLPMKPLCKPDCEGLCPQCGKNLNYGRCSCDGGPVDARLAALGEWLKARQGRGSES
jgi:uncharacterized protein